MYVLDTKVDKRLYGLRDELSSLVLNYLLESGNKITQNKRLTLKGAVGCFLLNTFYKSLKGVNNCGVTLNKNHYKNTTIINGVDTNRKVSYRYTRILLDFLGSNDYIKLHKGKVGEYGMVNGKWQAITFECGYVELLPKIKHLFQQHYHEERRSVKTKDNVIIVRNEKGCDVTFRILSDYLKDKKDKLVNFNVLTLDKEVRGTKNGKVYDVQMHTVYNGKTFDKGGKNYMSSEGIQNLSKEERMDLKITGEDTVIYDYQGFEPSIAYSMCQEVYIDDPYSLDISGFDKHTARSLCKAFLLIMFNVKEVKYLHSALNSMIKDTFDVPKLYEKGLIPDKRIDTKTIVQLIEDKHYLIKHMFYGETNAEPAYIGSLIADYVLEYFTQRGILVLSVFDEFIIAEQYEEELVTVMTDAYEFVLGFSDNCKVRKEK